MVGAWAHVQTPGEPPTMPRRIYAASIRSLCLLALLATVAPVTAALAQSKTASKPKTEESSEEPQTTWLPAVLITRDVTARPLPTTDAAVDESLSLAHASESLLFPEIDDVATRPQEADSTAADSLDVADALIGAIFFAVASLWISLR